VKLPLCTQIPSDSLRKKQLIFSILKRWTWLLDCRFRQREWRRGRGRKPGTIASPVETQAAPRPRGASPLAVVSRGRGWGEGAALSLQALMPSERQSFCPSIRVPNKTKTKNVKPSTHILKTYTHNLLISSEGLTKCNLRAGGRQGTPGPDHRGRVGSGLPSTLQVTSSLRKSWGWRELREWILFQLSFLWNGSQ
jgi:hypothetical protein